MILVTGGAGYIGSHFVLACIEDGREIVVLDDLSTGFRDAVPPGVPFVRGDFGDWAVLQRIIWQYDISSVVHFAGSVVVSDSIADPLGYYETNTTKTRTLLAHCVASGINEVVFSSTAAVYGPPVTETVMELAPTNPISPYGRSKLMVEWMLADAAAATDLRYVALRYFNVAGADPLGRAGLRSRNATHLLKRICEVAVGDRSHLDIYGNDYHTPDGSCIRDFIHVSDLAQAHLSALDHLRVTDHSVILNCGYGQGVSVLEAVQAISGLIGRDLPIRICDRRPGDIPAIVSDTTLMQKTLDWSPRFKDLTHLLDTALSYERQESASRLSVA
ncbi:UDP-glucose 4-epimerase GalE [Jannaschia donghaensis]|uniref:UDP-glucose 4-epimerase n=1 Tax=Jannaschia donghaensis TaxID=420998 RepID=A0A0M6YL53_9RHOB|nr:UDP-glucose 4-epimerase GalE [Jannaschia donghaensis]CTQ50624.1 UDP-glucose 4-epimerase [Jannaschia donghaensis]